MFACAFAPESVCAGRKGARQTSPPQETRNRVHSLEARSAGREWGRGPRRGREAGAAASAGLQRNTHPARSRARPPRSPRRAAVPPSLHSGGEGAVFRGRPGPRGGGGDWERASGAAGELSQPREEEGAGAGGGGGGSSAGSSSYEQGHVHGAPPGRAANRGEALRAASAKLPQGSGPHWGDPGGLRPPSALARPNYLSPSSLRPPPPQPPSLFNPRAWRTAPAPGARVGAPAWAPGRPGCEGIFHSFLSRAQTGTVFLPLGCSAA